MTRKRKAAPAPAQSDYGTHNPTLKLEGRVEQTLREARAMLDASDALEPEHFARAYAERYDAIVRDVIALAERLAGACEALEEAIAERDQAIADGADAVLERDQARDELEAERESREELQAQLDKALLERKRLIASLTHVSETSMDPDLAQFAYRACDGSALPPGRTP